MRGAGSDGGITWDVFLAHASADKPAARTLYDLLMAQGVAVCLDEKVLRPGDDWHALLPQYIRESSIVVALNSASTPKAHFERSEIIRAIALVRREGRRLVVVRLAPDVEDIYGTEQLHRIDAFDAAALPHVAEELADLVRNPETVSPMRATQVWCEDRIPAVTRWFTGRDELLAKLSATVEGGGTKVLTQTVSGLGGVGKTTLAAALADALRESLDVVWWARAEDPANLVADLAELAPRLGLTVSDETEEAAALVRRWLEERPGLGSSSSTTPTTSDPSRRGYQSAAAGPY